MYTNVNVTSFVLKNLLLCSSKEPQFPIMSSVKNKIDINLYYHFKMCT